MTITAEESCFHTAYLGITLIHFEGTFLTNIIARQLNGEMSTETIGHNHLNLFQNTVTKCDKIFFSAHSYFAHSDKCFNIDAKAILNERSQITTN